MLIHLLLIDIDIFKIDRVKVYVKKQIERKVKEPHATSLINSRYECNTLPLVPPTSDAPLSYTELVRFFVVSTVLCTVCATVSINNK